MATSKLVAAAVLVGCVTVAAPVRRGDWKTYYIDRDHDPARVERSQNVVVFIGALNPNSGPAVVDALEDAPEPKILVIDSLGGDADEMLHVGSYLLDNKVECIVQGDAQSAAFYILQTCNKRVMTQGSTLMTHEPHETKVLQHLTRQQLRAEANQLDTLADLMIIIEETRMNNVSVRSKIDGKDWTMNASEAKDAGAVDEVIPTDAFTLPGRD